VHKAERDMLVWETPFSAARFPSVQMISADLPTLDLMVYPSGLDADPVYRVRFSNFVAFRVHQEGMMPSSYPVVSQQPRHASCSFIVDDSNWKREFVDTASFVEASFGKPFSELKHYLIVGGDNVVEVLSHDPVIDRIDKRHSST
jgi:hypothetical protein